MASVSTSPSPATSIETGYIGKIPVRNLWLLMFYASGLFRQLGHGNITIEDNPEDIPDLVAELLTRAVSRRLKRNLSYGYQSQERVLGRVRGRIDLLNTERHQLLDRGKVACRFEELTADTPRNRFVRAALAKLAKIVRRKELAHRCRELDGSLQRLGVHGEKPSRSVVSVDRYGRHDAEDRQMVEAAHLAFDLALPTEAAGNKRLALPERNISWIRLLYEKAVAGFYDVVLSSRGWRIEAGKTLNWLIEQKTPGIDSMLPSMRTDIILDHRTSGQRIVIDTKFTSIVTKGWYREDSLRSGYLYQMYAYLRSQEGNGDALSASASGLLLHPSIDATVDEHVIVQGHQMRFATVKLDATAKEIRRQLLHVVGITDE